MNFRKENIVKKAISGKNGENQRRI